MEIYSTVISLQSLKKGESVSYDNSYLAMEDMQVAVIPFGYCEGLDRRLNNLAEFGLAGNYHRLAGSVCMNMSCLELSKDDKVSIGQEVQIVSNKPSQVNSIASIAKLEKTITHEVLIKFLANIRRIILDK